jgi:hypothetical protein
LALCFRWVAVACCQAPLGERIDRLDIISVASQEDGHVFPFGFHVLKGVLKHHSDEARVDFLLAARTPIEYLHLEALGLGPQPE